MVNLGDAYRKDEQKTVRATRAVVARQADNEKNEQRTNKERTKNEQKTNNERTKDEQMTVRAAPAKEQMTNNERRKDKAKVEIKRRLLVEFIL